MTLFDFHELQFRAPRNHFNRALSLVFPPLPPARIIFFCSARCWIVHLCLSALVRPSFKNKLVLLDVIVDTIDPVVCAVGQILRAISFRIWLILLIERMSNDRGESEAVMLRWYNCSRFVILSNDAHRFRWTSRNSFKPYKHWNLIRMSYRESECLVSDWIFNQLIKYYEIGNPLINIIVKESKRK